MLRELQAQGAEELLLEIYTWRFHTGLWAAEIQRPGTHVGKTPHCGENARSGPFPVGMDGSAGDADRLTGKVLTGT